MRARLPLLTSSFVRTRALPGSAHVTTDAEGRFQLHVDAHPRHDAPRPSPAATFTARRNTFLREGPTRHVLLLHAREAGRAPVVMREATARQALDRIFEGPPRDLRIDLEGDDPLDAWDVLRVVVSSARHRARSTKRRLSLGLSTSLAAMSAARCDWLLDHGVMLRVPFDAEASLHEAQRVVTGAAPFEVASRWITHLHARSSARGVDPTGAYLNATLTLSRHAADIPPRALVDACLRAGLRYVRVSPVDPVGLTPEAYRAQALPARDFIAIYDGFVAEALARTLADHLLVEMRFAGALERVLASPPPADQPRVACRTGAPTLAFATDGSVYTCDAATRLGDASDRFRLGHVATDRLPSLVRHEALRAVQAASHLDALPGCADCAYNPYCGVCPMHGLATRGAIAGPMHDTDWCTLALGLYDRVFTALASPEAAHTEAAYARWMDARAAVQAHYESFNVDV